MKLLDSNVALYAFGQGHPLKEPCQAILRRAAEDPGAFIIDTEALQEILHVYRVRGVPETGSRLVQSLLKLFPLPIPVGRREIEEACALFLRYPRLSARDAVHAAVVAVHRLEGIVSADRDFDGLMECPRFDPREHGQS